MFEKLSNLLFEDETIDDEEEEVIEKKPVEKNNKKVIKKRSLLSVDDDDDDEDIDNILELEEEKKSSFIQADEKKEEVKEKEVEILNTATPVVEQQPVEVEKEEKPSLGITVDELQDVKQVNSEPEVKAARVLPKLDSNGTSFSNVEHKKTVVKKSTSYEFSPVISPMFGVSDEEMNTFNEQFDESVTYDNTSRFDEQPEDPDEPVLVSSQVISPFWGTEIKVAKPEPKPVISEPVAGSESDGENVIEQETPSEVTYQSLDDLINEGRHASNNDDIEKTRAFRFEDLLKEDNSEKTVESAYENVNLFTQDQEEDHE